MLSVVLALVLNTPGHSAQNTREPRPSLLSDPKIKKAFSWIDTLGYPELKSGVFKEYSGTDLLYSNACEARGFHDLAQRLVVKNADTNDTASRLSKLLATLNLNSHPETSKPKTK